MNVAIVSMCKEWYNKSMIGLSAESQADSAWENAQSGYTETAWRA